MLIVIISVVTFCGSVYLLLATNLGARLGFLVALTGLAGWMALMGIIWMIYGIGLKGPEPSWEAIPGRTVLQDTDALYQAGVFDQQRRGPRGPVVPGGGRARRRPLRGGGLGAAGGVGSRVRPGVGHRGRAARGDRHLRRRRVPGGERLRHGRRALPDDRQLRPAGVPAQAALRRRRGRAARADARRAGPGAGTGADRRDAPAPVRVHDPRPRRPTAAGVLPDSRLRTGLPRPVLAAAPPRTCPDHQPRDPPGPGDVSVHRP